MGFTRGLYSSVSIVTSIYVRHPIVGLPFSPGMPPDSGCLHRNRRGPSPHGFRTRVLIAAQTPAVKPGGALTFSPGLGAPFR